MKTRHTKQASVERKDNRKISTKSSGIKVGKADYKLTVLKMLKK